jgi:hypothetical protein
VINYKSDFSHALTTTLKDSASVGRHTNVFHFHSLHFTKYLWAHKAYQPWGVKLPVQCPRCGIFKPWNEPTSSTGNDGSIGYTFNCKNLQCDKPDGTKMQSPHSIYVTRPLRSDLIKVTKENGGTGSGWLRIPVD